MLKTQQKLIDVCNELENIAKEHNLTETFIQNVSALRDEIAARHLVAPVVGAFSAGKSTLLNNCIGRRILPEAITPETALATELRFSQVEYIEAVAPNEKVTRYEITEMDALKSKAASYQYARLYLNSPALREIEPLVLVDMPGFDSPLDTHNKAILAYLTRGAYYIVLDSAAESKTPSSTLVRRLREIETMERRFSFFVSKTNLLGSPAEIDAMTAHYKMVLERELKHDVRVEALGDCSGTEVINLLKSIDADALFLDIYRTRITALCTDLSEMLALRINASQKSVEENNALIESMQNSVAKIETKAEKMIADIEERYSQIAVNDIVQTVGRDLNDALDELLIIGRKGDQAAVEKAMSDIVRVSLTDAVKSKMRMLINDITMDLSSETTEVATLMQNFGENDNFALALVDKAKSMLNELQLVDEEGDMQGKGAAYKSVTGIAAILTSFLPGWMEVVVVFLPEILGFFKKLFGGDDDLRQKLQTQVFPQIKGKIRSEIPVFLNNAVKNIIADVRDQYSGQIDQKRAEVSAGIESAKRGGTEQQKIQEQLTLAQSAVKKITKEII